MTISLAQIMFWFAWGFFMGAGWAIATWILSKILK
jgi:hypothetical protein